MKWILQFDSEIDGDEPRYRMYVNAEKVAGALAEYDMKLRAAVKYSDGDTVKDGSCGVALKDAHVDSVDKCRDLLWETFKDEGLSLEEITQ